MGFELQNRISPEVEMQIIHFLHREAYFLDHRKYKEWLELLDDEIEYRMPMRETVEGVGVNDIAHDSFFFEETKLSLSTRVHRLYTKSAWVENPATRQRHFITNVMVEPTEKANEFKVKSYFLFKRNRGSMHEIEEMFGEREDIIRMGEGGFKIVSRVITPDQTVMTTMNMSMFL